MGCNTNNVDFISLFDSVDHYLFEIDSKLCSVDCPCYVANPNNYNINSTMSQQYSKWIKTDKQTGAISYENCTNDVKNAVYNYYNSNYNKSVNNNYLDLNQTDFIKFYKIIEENFKCTGFCKISYNNRVSGDNTYMFKYLFSDLSK